MIVIPVPGDIANSMIGENLSSILKAFLIVLIIIFVIKHAMQSRAEKKKEKLETKNGWVYNESARMWVDPEQMDVAKNRKAIEENRARWKEFQERERRDEELKELHRIRMAELQAQIEATPDYVSPEDLERAKQMYKKQKAEQPPSFEEWKAAREQEQVSDGTT